jgi:hypothetical protein
LGFGLAGGRVWAERGQAFFWALGAEGSSMGLRRARAG